MSNSKISALTSATTPLAGTETVPVVQGGITAKVSVADLTAGRSVAMDTLATTGSGGFGTSTLTRRLNVSHPTGDWLSLKYGSTETLGVYDSGTMITFETPNVSTDRGYQFNIVGATNAFSISNAGNVSVGTGNLVPSTAAKGVNFTANTPAAGMTSQLFNWYEQGTFTPAAAGTTAAGIGTYSTQVGRYTRVGNLVTIKVSLAWSAHTGTGNLIFTGLPFTVANDGADSSMAVGYLSNLALTASNVLTLIARVNTTTVSAYQYPVGGGAASFVPIDTAVTLIEFSGTYNV